MTAPPCVTCVSLADCGTCLPRMAWEGAHVVERECLTCVDIDFLRACGYRLHIDIAERLGISTRAIHRHDNPHHRARQEVPA